MRRGLAFAAAAVGGSAGTAPADADAPLPKSETPLHRGGAAAMRVRG